MKDQNPELLARALLDPSQVFRVPGDVVPDERFSNAQKIEILRRWEEDALEMDVALEEGMGGGEPSRLEEVKQALAALGAGPEQARGAGKGSSGIG